MSDPVATILLGWGAFFMASMVIGEIAIAVEERKKRPIKIRYRGKTFVRKFKDDCDKVNRFEK
jgi:hypothetical protein